MAGGRQTGQQQQIERPVLEIRAEQPVERQQRGEQGADPDDARRDAASVSGAGPIARGNSEAVTRKNNSAAMVSAPCRTDSRRSRDRTARKCPLSPTGR